MGAHQIHVRDTAYPPSDKGSPTSDADTFIDNVHPHTVSTSAIETQVNPRLPVARRQPYGEHGALIDRSQTKEDLANPAYPNLMLPRIRRALREPLSEFMGVFILIMFGAGVVAQVTLSDGEKGNYQSISWGWGLGVMLGV